MKTIRSILTILALAAITISCEKKDDDFLQITDFERKLHAAINNYRTGASLNELTHDYNVVSRESKGHSEGRANGTITDEMVGDDLNQRWQNIENKFGVNNVSNPAILLSMVTGDINSGNSAEVAASLVADWAADADTREDLEGDYTLVGPGEGRTSDGRTYVTIIFCKFEQQ